MQFLENRYAQLAFLVLGLGLLFWAVIWLVLLALGIDDFPISLQLVVSFLGASVLVAKYLAPRIF